MNNLCNCIALQGHEAVVKALIEAKADVNHADNDGWTVTFLQ